MISITAAKDARIAVNTFTGYVMCNTDWQEWVRLQGEKLPENEGMEIILHSPIEIEVKTFVDNTSNTTHLEWQDFKNETKENRNKLWLNQWAELDKIIREFTEK